MPKLTIDLRTRGRAVAALLKLYKTDPNFARELKKLRDRYGPALVKWLEIAVPAWVNMKKTLTPEEFSETRDFFSTQDKKISNDLLEKLTRLLATPEGELAVQLGEYEKALTDLADKWQLKAAWAGKVLVINHILDMTINMLPEDVRKAEMPIAMLEPFLPSAPIPPLKFEVNPYELMFSGRQEIQQKFDKAFADYENKLKSLGWRELPSALQRHACWWFEHYVHHKTYDEISQSEVYTPDGSPISYARNVGIAVRNFIKLLGIEV